MGETDPPKPRRRLTRRRLLIGAGVSAVTLGGGAVHVRRRLVDLRTWAGGPLYYDEKSPVGTLGADAVATLLAMAEAVIELDFEHQHYDDYFRWRSQNVHGYYALYTRFTEKMTAVARGLFGKGFAELDVAGRRRTLSAALPDLFDSGLAHAAKAGLFAPEEDVRLYRYVVAETLMLFGRTDAFVHLGYTRWLGQSANLVDYTRPPTPTR